MAEALANVIKHARAGAVTVSARMTATVLQLTILDDGVGGADATAPGLRGLTDRVTALGGGLDVISPQDHWTRREVELPLAPGNSTTGSSLEDPVAAPHGCRTCSPRRERSTPRRRGKITEREADRSGR